MVRLFLFALIGIAWLTTAASGDSGALFSPDQRVLCNRDRAVCYDRFGPSIGLTQAFLGQEASDRLTDALRAVPPPAMEPEFSVADDIVCRREVGPCLVNGTEDATLTAVLFGPWASADRPDLASVLGIDWQWQGSRYSDGTSSQPTDPDHYVVRLEPSGRVVLRVDCNRAMGAYHMLGTVLTIQIGSMTRAACPPESLDTIFVRDLSAVSGFSLDGDRLRLEMRSADATGTMEFTR
jgi:heat shock protein HslJ